MFLKTKLLLRIVGLLSTFLGAGIIIYVLYPIVSYELTASRFSTYLTPVPDEAIDYTKASNWFDDGQERYETEALGIDYYTVSIPKLDIKGATVAIGGENLADSLIQYPGTAIPGKRGSSVIFGHSILPQFYDPEDYLAIFSKLPDLEKNDEIRVSYDGVDYLYRVEDMFEVLPTDIQILEQARGGSYLSLVTCTPPGHPLRPKRLVVKAKLIPHEFAWN